MSKILFDTNILIYGVDPEVRFFPKCNQLIQNAIDGNINMCIADKSLYEFYRTLTSKAYNKFLSHDKVKKLYKFYVESECFEKIYSTEIILDIVTQIIDTREVKGNDIFDMTLIAYAIANGIDTIYTKNIKDFPQDLGVEIVDPTI